MARKFAASDNQISPADDPLAKFKHITWIYTCLERRYLMKTSTPPFLHRSLSYMSRKLSTHAHATSPRKRERKRFATLEDLVVSKNADSQLKCMKLSPSSRRSTNEFEIGSDGCRLPDFRITFLSFTDNEIEEGLSKIVDITVFSLCADSHWSPSKRSLHIERKVKLGEFQLLRNAKSGDEGNNVFSNGCSGNNEKPHKVSPILITETAFKHGAHWMMVVATTRRLPPGADRTLRTLPNRQAAAAAAKYASGNGCSPTTRLKSPAKTNLAAKNAQSSDDCDPLDNDEKSSVVSRYLCVVGAFDGNGEFSLLAGNYELKMERARETPDSDGNSKKRSPKKKRKTDVSPVKPVQAAVVKFRLDLVDSGEKPVSISSPRRGTVSGDSAPSRKGSATSVEIYRQLASAILLTKGRKAVSFKDFLDDNSLSLYFPPIVYKFCREANAAQQNPGCGAAFKSARDSSSAHSSTDLCAVSMVNGGIVPEMPQPKYRSIITKPHWPHRCPWCHVIAPGLYSLLKHLRHCHPRLEFTIKFPSTSVAANNSAVCTNGELPTTTASTANKVGNQFPFLSSTELPSSTTHQDLEHHYVISVRPNHTFEGSYERLTRRYAVHRGAFSSPKLGDATNANGPGPLKRGRPRRLSSKGSISPLKLSRRKTAKPVKQVYAMEILVVKSIKPPLSCNLSEFRPDAEDVLQSMLNSFSAGHTRQYYRSQTCLPISADDTDADSEADYVPQWLLEKTGELIDEFTDVNPAEKEMMKLWNCHVLQNNLYADNQMHPGIESFIEQYSDLLHAKGLSRNFFLHLACLHKYGILPASSVSTLYEKFLRLKDDVNVF